MKRFLVIPLLFSVIAAVSWADPMVLDLDTSINLALQNNPDLKISKIELETAERAAKNTWNEFLPTLTASADLDGSSASTSTYSATDWEVGGSLSASLPLDASIAYSIKDTELSYESAKISYNTEKMNLVADVEQNFASLIASEADMDIDKANLELAQKRYEQTQTNFNNGLSSELDVLEAQVTAKTLEPTYLQTVADYKEDVREFLMDLGLDPETDVTFNGTLETPIYDFNSDDLINRYLYQRQDIKELQNELAIYENTKSLTAAEGLSPSLSLSAGWSADLDDAFDSSTTSDSWADGFSAGIGLSIPLNGFIPGSSTNLSVKEADDDVQTASISLAQGVDEARTEIINLVEQLKTSASNMDLSQLNVELTRRTYEMSEESFSRGTVERLDVEDAQQDYYEAQQDYLESQYTYYSGLVDLRVALGLDTLDELKDNIKD